MQEIQLRCGNTSIVAVAVLDSGMDLNMTASRGKTRKELKIFPGCTDDWVSSRFINRLKSFANDQDPTILNIPPGVVVPTFTDFNGNDKQPEGTIMATWRMTHRNPHLMYDSTFYINDSPNAPFDVLLGSRTLFGKGIYTLSRVVQGSLPLIHKPTSLRKSLPLRPFLVFSSSSIITHVYHNGGHRNERLTH